jgi:hypothetical protein
MTLISGCRLTARQFRSAVLLAAALVGLALVPALARADGDPASDVLASQSAFVPADAGASTVQLTRVGAVLEGGAQRLRDSRGGDRVSDRPWVGHGAVAPAGQLRPLFGR